MAVGTRSVASVTDLDRTAPRVSVVIPTHNRATAVVYAIESVLAQTFTDLEVIVVDDGSTDGTAALLAERYGGDSRVRVLEREQGGVSAARNLGLDQATGSLIAFLDSDDRWQPWKLDLQIECLAALPEVGMIWTEMRAVDRSGQEIRGSSLRDILSFHFGLDELFSQHLAVSSLPGQDRGADARDGTLHVGDIYGRMILGNMVLPSSVVMRRSCLERVGRFDETLEVSGEDFDFFLRTARDGPVAFLDLPTVLYQVGSEDQLTHPSLGRHLALNYLRTMESSLARDGRPAEVSDGRLRTARAYGHYWAGRAYLEAGDARRARHHILRALRLNPRNARTVAVAALAILPSWIRGPLFRVARGIQQRRGA